ncbi:gnat family [Podospora conica]|nr:gnat family [Schizothecium conicum]
MAAPTSSCSIRDATPADLDQVVQLVLAAMPHEPHWNYRFAHKDEFPDDHVKFTRLLYEQFISPANDDWRVTVAEASDDGTTNIVGFTFGPDYEPQNPMAFIARSGGAQRRDIDPRRQEAFKTIGNREKQQFFDSVWGDQQLHLQILGVHPDCWRRGIGSKLVRWGVDLASKEKIPLTVLASSLGLSLYTRLGFRDLGSSVTQVPGEVEKVDTEALVYEVSSAIAVA